MATFNKVNSLTYEIGRGRHDFSSHTFKVALTNTAPVVGNTVLADITQVAATGGYVSGGYLLDGVAWSEASGVSKLVITDEVITAVGGSVGPFRYAVIYNDSTTSPVDALIGWYDYGSSITLADGETLTLDFDATNGVLTLT